MSREGAERFIAQQLKARGIGIIPHPMGEGGHHTDVPISDEDLQLGCELSYFLGSLFCDVDQDRGQLYSESWFYSEMTSVNLWARIARALRIHGLRITTVATTEEQPCQQTPS